mgnify:CR=1 FL=1
MECRVSSPESLAVKGINHVIECVHEPKNVFFIEELHKHAYLIKDFLSKILDLRNLEITFSENEAVGTDYIIYSYKVFHQEKYVGTCRFITRNNKLIKSLCTISGGITFEQS